MSRDQRRGWVHARKWQERMLVSLSRGLTLPGSSRPHLSELPDTRPYFFSNLVCRLLMPFDWLLPIERVQPGWGSRLRQDCRMLVNQLSRGANRSCQRLSVSHPVYWAACFDATIFRGAFHAAGTMAVHQDPFQQYRFRVPWQSSSIYASISSNWLCAIDLPKNIYRHALQC